MRKYIVSLIIILGAVISSVATEANSAYFVKGYNLRHKLTPAFSSEFSYISLPVIGGSNIDLSVSPGISTLIQPTPNGSLTTFMSPTVDAKKFLSKIKANNPIGIGTELNILSLGINGRPEGRKHFTSFDIRLNIAGSASIPYGVYEFLKAPLTNRDYYFNNLSASVRSYIEVAIGHSFNINDHLRVGAKIKGIIGLANADVKYDNLKLSLTEDCWEISGKGNGRFFVPGLKTPNAPNVDLNEYYDGYVYQLELTDLLNSMKSNIGVAADLGVIYNFGGISDGKLSGLTLSASITDLGFINNRNYLSAVTKDVVWSYTGLKDIPINGDVSSTISEQIDDLVQQLSPFIQPISGDNSQPYRYKLNRNIYLGTEYQLSPILSFGALFNSSRKGFVSTTEVRLSANLRLCKGINLSASYGTGTLGGNIGGVLAINTPSISFFLGTNSVPTRLAAGVAPLPLDRINARVFCGACINLGKRRTVF